MVSANNTIDRPEFVDVDLQVPSASERRVQLERDLLEILAHMAMVIEAQNLRINTLESLAGYARVQRQHKHLLRALKGGM